MPNRQRKRSFANLVVRVSNTVPDDTEGTVSAILLQHLVDNAVARAARTLKTYYFIN